jgi:SpoVK/Ycf46/Vps4 family AAA+-type ATPase
MNEAYASNVEHLQDELTRLDLMIQLALGNNRKPDAGNEFPGLIISEKEIEGLLKPDSTESPSLSTDREELNNRLKQQTIVIRERVSACEKKGLHLRFSELARIFGLTSFEIDAVLICLAPELDQKYQKLYGYLQDDITKKHPTLALIGRMLCLTFEETIRAREFFLADAPLVKYNILSLEKDAHNSPDYLMSRPLVLDERITGFLTGSRGIDPVLSLSSTVSIPANVPLGDPNLSHETQARIVRFIEAYLKGEASEKPLFYFHGPDEEGKKQMAEAVSRSVSLPLLRADMNSIKGRGADFRKNVCLLFREGLLSSTGIFLEHIDSVWEKEEDAAYNIKVLQDLHRDMGWITFLSGENPWPYSHFREDVLFLQFDFPVLPLPQREQYWQSVLKNGDTPGDDIDLSSLAMKFRFTRSQIRDTALVARNNSRLRDGQTPKLTMEDLYTACRSRSNQKLLSFGRKIVPRYSWNDIVLPKDIFSQLRELCAHVAYHARVYDEWGFDAKHNLGKGLNILFSGSSGTGKTMAAEVMANELKLDLYKIDLSNVVSKYIGETEKNLSRIFYEAETSNAILFFDEADALFGKRSEVRDSHDRYANIEINYLLQKMEEQDGIVILATNMSKNIDNAFLRRLHFFINFPSPEKEERLSIWKAIFPGQTPLANDVDFQFLARNLDITGGVIKNIALRAAFMAAGDSGAVNMKHVVLASKREFQKIGKLCLETEFKEYFDLVK